jgi:hypothetical protein
MPLLVGVPITEVGVCPARVRFAYGEIGDSRTMIKSYPAVLAPGFPILRFYYGDELFRQSSGHLCNGQRACSVSSDGMFDSQLTSVRDRRSRRRKGLSAYHGDGVN